MRGIYHFFWDCGRMGELTGMFVADSSEVAAAVGRTASFDDVLGKHSEIYEDIKTGDIRLCTEDQEFIDKAIEYGVVPTGYNPLDYLSDIDDE
jgi:hypothetical protein